MHFELVNLNASAGTVYAYLNKRNCVCVGGGGC